VFLAPSSLSRRQACPITVGKILRTKKPFRYASRVAFGGATGLQVRELMVSEKRLPMSCWSGEDRLKCFRPERNMNTNYSKLGEVIERWKVSKLSNYQRRVQEYSC
jgi:hypothetical protein